MTPGAALLVALLSQTSADLHVGAAGAGSARLRLEVAGDASCVSRGDLAARIAARSARIEISDDAALLARIVVGRSPAGKVAADLSLDGEPARRVVGRSCSEVADGVGLIIAVTLDPSLRAPAEHAAPPVTSDAAVQKDEPHPPPAASRPIVRAGAGPAPRPDSSVRPPAPVEKPDVQPTPALRGAANPPLTQGTRPRREFRARVAGQALFGPAPAVMPGVALYVMGAIDRDGPWAPALVVGATHAWRSDLVERGGQRASFVLDAATVDACPLRVRWLAVTARPCVGVLVGRFVAQGSNTDGAQTVPRPFAATGAVLTASAGSTVEAFARFGLAVTVVRDAYEFGTDVFHRASLFMFSASVGVGTSWR